MSKLFGRSYKLILDTLQIEGGGDDAFKFGLDIAFKVEKTIKAEPNKATIQVWNLSADVRQDFERRFGSEVAKSKRKPIRVELSAGYGTDIGVIFRGDLRNLVNKRDPNGVDWITEVTGSDGGHSFKTSRVSRSFAPGVAQAVVLRACVDALGIGEGNLSEFTAGAKLGPLGSTFPDGCILHGSAEHELDHLVKGAGLTWSVQEGALQLKKNGQPLQSQVFELSPDTGLIGSPYAEVDATVMPGKADSKQAAARSGLVNVKTLLLHQLVPGHKVKLSSDQFSGGYQVNELAFVGNTAGSEWHADSKVKQY